MSTFPPSAGRPRLDHDPAARAAARWAMWRWLLFPGSFLAAVTAVDRETNEVRRSDGRCFRGTVATVRYRMAGLDGAVEVQEWDGRVVPLPRSTPPLRRRFRLMLATGAAVLVVALTLGLEYSSRHPLASAGSSAGPWLLGLLAVALVVAAIGELLLPRAWRWRLAPLLPALAAALGQFLLVYGGPAPEPEPARPVPVVVRAEERAAAPPPAAHPPAYPGRPPFAATAAYARWAAARLRCRDGTLSPTCTCGRESYGGCCSHHGGVAGCSEPPP